MRAQRKLVRAIGSQATNESRRVWRDVTVGLRADDIDGATRAKCIVEQTQRESAKQREITNQPWETAVHIPFLILLLSLNFYNNGFPTNNSY